MKRHFFIVLLVLVSPLFVLGQSDEQSIVRRVVEDYLSKKDPEAVKRSLSADPKIFSVDGRGRVTETRMSKKTSKERTGATVTVPEQKIVAIDITEGGASVKVESEFAENSLPQTEPRKHIQYISLLKVNGEWKIVSILMPPWRLKQLA